jgi:hypothetical protein
VKILLLTVHVAAGLQFDLYKKVQEFFSDICKMFYDGHYDFMMAGIFVL